MFNFLEQLASSLWNRFQHRRTKRPESCTTVLGYLVHEEQMTKRPCGLSQTQRTRHLAVLGLTGSGKSFFIRHIAQESIEQGLGFVLFDQHGDLIPALQRHLVDLGVDPARVILLDPASPAWAVGMNPLEAADDTSRFLQVAEITRNLADRWDFKGARTEELLRNALFVLSANGLTILEVALLLSDNKYRTRLLDNVANAEVREYFTLRYDPLSDAMKATMREPVLNKLSEFTADPHFRHVLGQRESTFSFDDVLATDKIVLVNINKGQLGIHAMSFGSLVLTKVKAAIFRRQRRALFSVFVDEVQNIVAADTDFDVLFSEARKFGVGIVTANQFLAQLPPKMRSAVQAVGTRIFFQLSPEDANHIAQEIEGGKPMAEKLRNLPARHFVMKYENHRAFEAVTPTVTSSKTSVREFIERSHRLHAKLRADVESDILARRSKAVAAKEVLDDWE